jgi:parvulin-like peptidyl-prolyl isomerase
MQRWLAKVAPWLGTVGLCACKLQAASVLEGLFDDPVIARGSNVLVKSSQLESAFIAYKANLAGRGEVIPEDERLARERLLLDRLILTQLLKSRATPEDRKRAEEMATDLLARTVRELGSEAALARRLKVLGLTGEQYTNQVMDQALAQAVVDREVRSKIEISPAAVEEFYQTGTDVVVRSLQAELQRLAQDPKTSLDRLVEVKKQIDTIKQLNLSRFQQPERVRVSHIMLATRDRQTELPLSEEQKRAKRAQIEKLRVAALAGEDFQKLILEYSEDRNVQANKGEYLLTRDAPFVQEFKAAAFALPPGQISEVITTEFGYHILKVSERIPARKIPLEEAAAEIRALLLEQELQKRLPAYFRTLKQEAGVEILQAKYRIEPPAESNPLKD